MKQNQQAKIDIALIEQDKSRIIEMAWEDKTTFDAIKKIYGLDESALMKLMKASLTFGSYKLWRKRVKTQSCKHLRLRTVEITRAFSPTQYKLRN
ncbi:MAG: TIGR03643 family protein [Methylophilaceae bacterium]|jgi:uncharacterized protein (TIGR03643 family)|nr:MAG: TIGR03643 family protein [Methylophilaceae bacterium]